jgi:hypothetical protein
MTAFEEGRETLLAFLALVGETLLPDRPELNHDLTPATAR